MTGPVFAYRSDRQFTFEKRGLAPELPWKYRLCANIASVPKCLCAKMFETKTDEGAYPPFFNLALFSSREDITLDQYESNEPTGVGIAVPEREVRSEHQERHVPRYHVILWDSDDHTYEYVEKMLRELFGHTATQCKKLADDVDANGRTIVLTTTQEHAELKRDQIHAYGRDHLEGSLGSMWSSIEATE